MRALTAQHQLNAAQRFTQPLYLLELDLPTGALRFTSRGPSVSWDGKTWNRLCQVESLAESAGASLLLSVRLDNADDSLRAPLITADPRRRAARLWEGHGSELIQRFDGQIGGIESAQGWVALRASSGGNRSVEVRLAPPFVTYLTPPGTLVRIGGETIVLEGRS